VRIRRSCVMIIIYFSRFSAHKGLNGEKFTSFLLNIKLFCGFSAFCSPCLLGIFNNRLENYIHTCYIYLYFLFWICALLELWEPHSAQTNHNVYKMFAFVVRQLNLIQCKRNIHMVIKINCIVCISS